MTANERAFFLRMHRNAATFTPEIAAAILGAFRAVAETLPEATMTRLIASGTFDLVVASILTDAVLNVALRPVRSGIQRTLQQAVTYVARDLPAKAGTLVVQFNVLNTNVLAAIRTLDDKILPTLKADIRESVRRAVEAGLEAGANPRTIARGLRDVVGLSPAQELAVRNYRAQLDAGEVGAATSRQLHDARFRVTKDMSAEKIDRMVTVYRKNMVAFHAETVARTATLDAFRNAQDLAWRQAIDAGLVDGDNLLKTWMQVDRPTKRESHIPLNGETVPFDQPYSNGDMVPGEGPDEWNCACLSRVHLGRAA